MQNAYIERKNGSMRRGLLNAYVFNSLAEVRCLSEQWGIDYSKHRPPKSLGYHSLWSYADQWLKKNDSFMEKCLTKWGWILLIFRQHYAKYQLYY